MATTDSLAVLLCAVLLAASGAAQEAPQGASQEPARRGPERTVLTELVTTPMIEGFNWVVVEVGINGQGPFRMILDTGAGVTVLNEDLVAELGLVSTGTRRIGNPANPEAHEVDVLTVDLIEVEAARFEGVAAVGWCGPSLVAMGGIRGVLGFPTFADCLLTLDYPRGQVELVPGGLPKPDGKEILPMKLNGTPSIPVEIAGFPFDAHLDAGNSGSLVVPASWRDRMPVVEGSVRRGRAVRGGTPANVTNAQLNAAIKLGSAVIESPAVQFDDELNLVNVGHAILKNFRVSLDQKNGRLRLTRPGPGRAADAVVTPVKSGTSDAAPRFMGVRMSMKNGTVFTVESVDAGSAGERAGLLSGDELLELDGEPVTQARIRAALKGTKPMVLTIERDGARKKVTLFAKK